MVVDFANIDGLTKLEDLHIDIRHQFDLHDVVKSSATKACVVA